MTPSSAPSTDSALTFAITAPWIMAFFALVTLLVTCWYNHRTAQLALRAQIISLFKNFLDIAHKHGGGIVNHQKDDVEQFYSAMVAFSQLVDAYGLKCEYKFGTLESFWLLCPPYIWTELHNGAAAVAVCSNDPGTKTLSNHRKTVTDVFEQIIEKHCGHKPIHTQPTVGNGMNVND